MKAPSALFLMGLAACGRAITPVGTPPPAVIAADSAIRTALSHEQSLDASLFSPRAVAVAPFRVVSADTTLAVLGFGLADFLMTDLARSRQIQVVDRLRLDALVRELDLVRSGAVDSTSAARFGRLVSARRIVLGSLTTTGTARVRLDGRVGDVASGVIDATGVTETSIDEILDAEKALAFAIFDRLNVVLTPAERSQVEQRRTRNLQALLAYSRGVRDEMRLDYQSARREYQAALRADRGFGIAAERLDGVAALAPAEAAPVDAGVPRAGALALDGVVAPALPSIATAADPAFRRRFLTTITLILNLP